MLTETQIRKAKPSEKAKRLWDERGMYLEVTPAGSKLWRFKYRIDGREKRIGLGKYPDVGLKDARERREDARKLLANGVDPSLQRQAIKAAAVLEAMNTLRPWRVNGTYVTHLIGQRVTAKLLLGGLRKTFFLGWEIA